MAIPKFRDFLRPVLEVFSERGESTTTRSELVDLVKHKMSISDEDATERLESGGYRLRNRTDWAITYLKKANLIQSPSRGQFKITPTGQNFLKEHNGPFRGKDLLRFSGFQAFCGHDEKGQSLSQDTSDENIDELNPEEKIELGYKEIKSNLVSELQEKILEFHPTKFEEFVLTLVRALGYGIQMGRIEHNRRFW